MNKPRFWKSLKKTFSTCYDYLGLTILGSIIWFSVVLMCYTLFIKVLLRLNPVLAGVGVLVLYAFIISPVLAGGYCLARQMLIRDDPSARDLLRGIREYGRSAFGLGFVQAAISGLILINALFYLKSSVLPLRMVGILFIYVLLFWMINCIYHFPILIEQRPGILSVLKRGALIAADNVVFTLGVFFVIILLTAATLVIMPLVYFGLVSVLQTVALRMAFVKYGLLPPEVEPTEVVDPGFRIRD